MPLVDTHAHLDQDQFDADRAETLDRAHAAGVKKIVVVAVTADSSDAVVQLASDHDMLLAAVGIHPNYTSEAQPGDWDSIVAWVDHPRVVAIGETGLDRFREESPFELQQEYFDRHIRLSQERGKPFIVHMRECAPDIYLMLEEARRRGPLLGVMHSFTGDGPLADACLALGMYISFAGMVTYKKSAELRALAATIPADRILVETDSPYLSPEPLRGKRNEPANVVRTAACIAAERGQTLEDFSAQATANAARLFGFQL